MMRRTALLGLLAAATCTAVAGSAAAMIGDALDRPALVVRRLDGVVLLAGAQAGDKIVAVGERGIAMHSPDGGRHWQQADVPVSVTLTSVRFVGATAGWRGWATGHGGVVLTSDDAGATWTRRFDGHRAAELAVKVAEATGEATAIKAARQLVADGADKPFFDVLTFDAQRALVVGAYGLAFATNDGGASWTPRMAVINNPKQLHLYAVRARGERVVIAGEQGLVLCSDDGGAHFERLAVPYAGSFFTLELPGADEIVVAGLRGNVWRSTDAGVHWAQVQGAAPVSITGSALRADGSLVLVDQAGGLASLRGEVLAPIAYKPLPPLNAVLATDAGGLVAFGIAGVVVLPTEGKP